MPGFRARAEAFWPRSAFLRCAPRRQNRAIRLVAEAGKSQQVGPAVEVEIDRLGRPPSRRVERPWLEVDPWSTRWAWQRWCFARRATGPLRWLGDHVGAAVGVEVSDEQPGDGCDSGRP